MVKRDVTAGPVRELKRRGWLRQTLKRDVAAGLESIVDLCDEISRMSTRIKTMRFELWGLGKTEATRAMRAEWLDVSIACQEMTNLVWQYWLVWHVAKQHPAALRRWLADFKRAKAADPKAKGPRHGIDCFPPVVAKGCYDYCRLEWPQLHGRISDLIRQRIVKTMMERKAAKGSLPGWVAILLARESVPSFIHPVPIPIDAKSAVLVPGDAAEKRPWRVQVRLCATPPAAVSAVGNGRPKPRKSKPSRLDVVDLAWPKSGHGLSVLSRLADGTYKMLGSMIQRRPSDGKWYLLVTYRLPAATPADVDPAKTAVLIPGRRRLWRLRIDGRSLRVGGRGGRGRSIAHVRGRLNAGRWTRQEGYRYAGHANKGHGRDRALSGFFRLSQYWKDFSKTYNNTITKQVVAICIDRSVGRLVYYQPESPTQKSVRLLVSAGRVDRDPTSWDFFQVATQLGQKCQDVGIELVVRKMANAVEAASVSGPKQ